ncbi:MAG: lysine--tRNA ligase [Candidatus Kerfeldbacteria bacterium]|nr:lysine--tRNA ligase [Candidatus Kerfeldbacteria bacterium]
MADERPTGHSEREDRRWKLERLRSMGLDPYPSLVERTHTIADFLRAFAAHVQKRDEVVVVGRIRTIRRHGGSTFVLIEDGTAQMQVYIRRDRVGAASYELVRTYVDPGDYVGVRGAAFTTKTGQQSLDATAFRILTKALRPLPEKYHGLRDTETRLRKRYLDLLASEDVRALFRQKARFWQSIRTFLLAHDFLEVETPVLENVPGGADAEPFVTHHRALDRDFFLRISLELPLKRLLVGGFERVFEIGRIFRNEGISSEHLQDYTQLEFYWAFADYTQLMSFVEELYQSAIQTVTGSLTVASRGRTIDWKSPWKRYDYYELFQTYVSLDLRKATEADLKAALATNTIPHDGVVGRGRSIDLLYKTLVRPHLQEPGFLLDPPVDIEPLAKRHPDDPQRVQRFQVVAWGTELGKGFSELNDPGDQRERFLEQQALRTAGDTEAQRLDEDFIEALEYGMPPAAGFGFSERLFAYLMDRPLRETVLFPPMKQATKENES